MSSFCEKNVFVCTSCGARPQRSLKGRPPVVPGYDPRTIGRTETAGLGARGQVCSDCDTCDIYLSLGKYHSSSMASLYSSKLSSSHSHRNINNMAANTMAAEFVHE